ncbi:MAG: hypothetical protein JNL11_18235 [Bdellovibrionaceae bacterium]|nr:hypothetical protein [Pseudobdellovibrionaceae bacterium]
MKKYISIIVAQIFLVNSLFIAPTFADPASSPSSKDEETNKRWQAAGVSIVLPSQGAADQRILVVLDKAFEFKISYEQRQEILQDLAARNVSKDVDQVTFKKIISSQLFEGYSYDEISNLMTAKKIKLKWFADGSKVYNEKLAQMEPRKTGTVWRRVDQGRTSSTLVDRLSDSFARTQSQNASKAPTSQTPQMPQTQPALSTAPILGPEKNIEGTPIDVTLTHSQVDKDNDGKPDPNEVETKVEEIKLKDLTPEQRKALHDAYSPAEMRKLLLADRKALVKQMIEDWVNPINPNDPRSMGKAQREAQRAQGTTQPWESTVFGSQSRRFPMETMMFFFSIGLINGMMLLNDFSQNPLLMEQHLQTLMDPIGHISFYSFMIVNGYTTEFMQNRAIGKAVTADVLKHYVMSNPRSNTLLRTYMTTKVDEKLRGAMLEQLSDEVLKVADKKRSLNPYTNTIAKQAYFRMINYVGMTAGSMASHFSGDFLRTLQSCAKGMYKDAEQFKREKESSKAFYANGQQPVLQKDRLNGLSEDPCDVAWREWVMEKKFNQYSPALMSMILSTMGSGALTSLAARAKATGPYKNIAEIVNKGKVAVSKVSIGGAELGTTLLGGLIGGVWTKSMRLLHHFATITIFTGIDTAIHGWVEDKSLNFNYGYYYLWPNIDAFPRKAEILDKLITKEAAEGFRKDTDSCEKDIQSTECRRNDIEGWMYDFSQAMMKWREFNQTKAMQAHSQWIDKVNKFQYMERLSKAYYERFISDIKNVYLCNANRAACLEAKPGEKLGDDFEAMESGALSTRLDRLFLNYRQYPLYGVEPDETAKDFPDFSKWKDYYMQAPDVLQSAQQIRVHRVAQQLETYLNRRGFDSDHLKSSKSRLEEILKGLKSENVLENGKAIDLMRSMVATSSREVPEIVQAILREHLAFMGSPAPLLYYGQGFPYAFESHSINRDLVKIVELPEFYRHFRLSTKFYFEKKTDYIFYNMMCGPSPEQSGLQASVVDGTLGNLYGKGMLGFRDLFIPPKIISDNLQLDICTGSMDFKRSSALYNQWIIDTAKNMKYAGGFNVIDKNLSESMTQIIKSEKLSLAFEDRNEVDRQKVLSQPIYDMSLWWEKYVETQVQNQLDIFKVQYEEIAVKFLEAQFKDVGTLLGRPLHSSIVRNSVVSSSLQESRTYSLILSEVLKRNIPEAEFSKHFATNAQFLGHKNFLKQKDPEDILKSQISPFNQDFAVLKSGGTPKLFKFQLTNEEVLSELYYALKKAVVVEQTSADGKTHKVVDLKMDEKQIDELGKRVDESINRFSSEIDEVVKLMPEMKNNGKNERAKPLRIIEFSKDQMAKIVRELFGTLSTIRYVRNASETYAKKNLTEEERRRAAEKATSEEAKKKCSDSKRASGITGGGGC